AANARVPQSGTTLARHAAGMALCKYSKAEAWLLRRANHAAGRASSRISSARPAKGRGRLIAKIARLRAAQPHSLISLIRDDARCAAAKGCSSKTLSSSATIASAWAHASFLRAIPQGLSVAPFERRILPNLGSLVSGESRCPSYRFSIRET